MALLHSTPPHHHYRIRASSSSSPSPSLPPNRALIIGAGLSGLAAALRLHSSSIPFLLIDSSDAVGGRVRTDLHRGFLLDRGFQIFLTAYPEARSLLHYPSLRLRPFYPGALVFHDGSFHRVADPLRRPLDGLLSLSNPIGTLPDKLRIGLARLRSSLSSDSSLLSAPELPLLDRLLRDGFSSSVIDRFFRPFFGGIFFDRDLQTTSRLFDFVFKCLALGDNTLPADGIAAIPEQLAQRLPPGSIRLRSKVESIDLDTGGAPRAVLSGGEVVEGYLGSIVAVEEQEAARLLPGMIGSRGREGRRAACVYFAAEEVPIEGPMLLLNGTGKGVVNNVCFPTSVAPTYGPEGKVLVSVTVVGEVEGDLEEMVVRELAGWFGETVVRGWEHLRTYRIAYAQPDQRPPTEVAGREPRLREGVYVCGDHWSSSTFDGALLSGRRAAEALLADRGLLREIKNG